MTHENSTPNTLPPWFKPDKSAWRKGKLLYLEEWGKKRKFGDRSHVIMGPVLIFMGLMVVAIGLDVALTTGDMTALIFFGGIGTVVSLMGFGMFKLEVQTMPFAVYENGFTLVDVPLKQGWHREESFVPWTRLESVALEETSMYNVAFRSMKLKYDVDKELELGYGSLTDPFEVMKLFKRYVLEKMNKAFTVYVGDENERKIIGDPFHGKSSKSDWLIPLGLIVFMSFITGSSFADVVSGEKSLVFLVFILPVFLIPAAIFFYMSTGMLDRRAQRDLIEKQATFNPEGISISKTFYGKHIKHIRGTIPWKEIKAVRMKLNSVFYYHEAGFETVAGEKYRIPYKIYEKMEQNPDFQKEEWDYVNITPAPTSAPLESWNPKGLAVFITLLAVPAVLVAFTGAGEGIWDQWDEVWSNVCIGLIFAVLLPFYIFARWRMAQRGRLGEDLFATSRGISIPNAPAKLRQISPESFINARIEKDLYGLYCELNTTKGSIKLPQASAEMLIHAGYPVENAGDLGALPFEGYLGEKPAVSTREPLEEASLPETIAPGGLILEESAEALATKKKKLLQIGVGATVAGAAFFILMLPPIGVLSTLICGQTCFIMLAITLFVLGLVGMKLSFLVKPAYIHENGIVFPDPSLNAGKIFVPYGRITNVEETIKPVWGEVVNFYLDENRKYTIIKSTPGFVEIFSDIKEKIGKPEYDCRSFKIPYQETMPIVEKLFTAIAFGIGFGMAALYVDFMGVIDYQVHWGKILLYGAPLTLVLLVAFAYILQFSKDFVKKLGQNLYINTQFFGLAILITVLIFFVGLAVDTPSIPSQEIFHDSPPSEFAYGGGLIENESLELKQSIYVQEDSSLLIRNSTITFIMTEDKGCSIYVAEGGRLEIMNSSIGSAGSEYGYGFEIYGEAIFADSRFSGIYGPDDIINGDGGMEIYSDDVILFNCTITDNPVNGILIARASPTIENCVIKGNKDDGIEIHHSNAKIVDCTFLGNGWGMVVFSDSRCQVLNNSFKDNEHGVHVEFSSPEIKDNIFENNTEYAVSTVYGSDVDYNDNTFINNGAKFHEEKTLEYYFSMCGIGLLIIGFVAGGIVIFKARNTKTEQ